MKSLVIKSQILLAGLFLPLFAWAQAPESIEQVTGMLQPILALISNGNYLAAAAGITMILVLGFRKLVMPRLGLGVGVLPLVSAVIGVLSGAMVSVYGGATLTQGALAMLAGPAAGLLWDAVIKYFVKK